MGSGCRAAAWRLFDNSGDGDSAHDVAAAYRLAMADVRVRLPLGTSFDSGCGKAWPIRLPWEQESAGSNPAIPTGCLTRRFRWSSCWYEYPAVNRGDAGSIPAA